MGKPLDSDLKRFAAVFGCAFAIYLAFFGGHYVSGDEAQRIAWAKALIDCHCNDISPYFPSEHYAKYGIGLSILHVLLILLAQWIKPKRIRLVNEGRAPS